MKKRMKLFIILGLALVLMIGATITVIMVGKHQGLGTLSLHYHTDYAEATLLDSYEKNDWQADWIWVKKSHKGEWAVFTKDVTIDDASEAIAYCATDTHYFLWVNGNLAVFEGGLKRGLTTTSTYYDEIDLSNYLVEGKNTITILVNYLGDNGYSHLDSGHGGLIFECLAGETLIKSDSTWKAMEYSAYKYDPLNFSDQPTYRLAESPSNIYGKNLLNLKEINGDSSVLWDQAIVVSDADEIFGATYLNILPEKEYSDILSFTNSRDYEGMYFSKRTKIVLNLPENIQFTPYFNLETKPGKTMKYYTENYKLSFKNTFHTGGGEEEFEDYNWINGETLTIIVPAGTTINKIGYRASGYYTIETGEFETSDEFMNSLYEKSLSTLKVTMRDNYMDCPDRERAQWIGDAVIESEMAYYSLDKNATLLTKKAILTLYGWRHTDGVFQTVAPDGIDAFELPLQNLAAITMMKNYLLYTGDYSVFNEIYSLTLDYLKVFSLDESGLVVHRSGSWDWGDWGNNQDITVMENAWYYMALSCAKSFAEYKNDLDDISFCEERMEKLEKAFNEAFWVDGSYKSGKNPDDRANALAVISGLASNDKYDSIASVLTSVYNSSPYMEKYVEEALFMMGRGSDALTRMKQVYQGMVSSDYSTLWESWDESVGTKNHAWSGGPLVLMKKYIAGITPTSSGYATFVISPDLEILDSFQMGVEVRDEKDISVTLNKSGSIYSLTIESDIDGGSLVLDGSYSSVTVNGVQISKTDGKYKSVLAAGINEIIVTR
ncbi:MAG: hypothetical protein H6687_00720 [Bacillales bacterium]|nr:hypothetical protein [Bacillales bacterium]